jgi:hypothetical protein
MSGGRNSLDSRIEYSTEVFNGQTRKMFHPPSFAGGRPLACRRGALAALAAAAGTALCTAGCSQVLPTQLPELVAVSRQVLSEEEQKKAVDELTAKKETHHGEAIKVIENQKAR